MLIISKVLLYWTVIVANNNNNWHLKQISSSHRFYIRSTNLSILIKTFENILSFEILFHSPPAMLSMIPACACSNFLFDEEII